VLQLTLPALVQSKSLLLIDEIEDGLHYSVVDPLIRSLISLCIENDIQMFCTTHSDEILERFASITAEQKISDIALFRLEKIDSKIAVQRYDSKEFLASREIRAEVR
jgi:AAA15 family ATPase/GTPase